jgi:hypothetical protein
MARPRKRLNNFAPKKNTLLWRLKNLIAFTSVVMTRTRNYATSAHSRLKTQKFSQWCDKPVLKVWVVKFVLEGKDPYSLAKRIIRYWSIAIGWIIFSKFEIIQGHQVEVYYSKHLLLKKRVNQFQIWRHHYVNNNWPFLSVETGRNGL